ncbi:MAG: dihydroorotate dehydrogenase [Candidatus Omnitrophota bacterium]|nr:dihydroorotate dehydrogenase [Candidatus Omnitrophota bacterium]
MVTLPELSVKIGRIKMANPVMVASGTFGYGREYQSLIDQPGLGAIVTKSITLKSSAGNPGPRICETSSGMLNAIGLQNNGLDDFIKEKMPGLRKIKVPLIVSIAGDSIGQYQRLAKGLNDVAGIAGLEINVSCPNIKTGMVFSRDPKLVYNLIKAVKKAVRLTIITKLSANVTDIASIARAARDGGTDAVSLINSLPAMAVDINTKKPKLANITGGLSGPAIKPVALKAVWEVSSRIKLPLVGMGGIMNWQDAVEFMICGATAISVGTANFVDPRVSSQIVNGLSKYLETQKIDNVNKLRGSLKTSGK